MIENKRNRNTEILIEAVNSLRLEFPVKEISEAMGIDKGNLSSFLNGKKVVSTKFLQKFADTYNIDLEKYNKNTTEIKEDDPYIDALTEKLFSSEKFKKKLKEEQKQISSEELIAIVLKYLKEVD